MRIFSHNARNNDRVTGMFDRYLGQNLRENDADDAQEFLLNHNLINSLGEPTFHLRP